MLAAGTQVPVGLSYATALADMDFETYSEAGLILNPTLKWSSAKGIGKQPRSIFLVGAPVYAMHPSTEILCLYYDLKEGNGRRAWVPGMPAPQDLFDYIAAGGLIEAHNSAFEFYIWNCVGTQKLGWPELPLLQLRCSASKAKAWSLPAALGKVSPVVGTEVKDSAKGKRVIKRYCEPRNPTKKDPRTRILPSDEPEGVELYEYCEQDIISEASVSLAIPDLSESELETWQLDQIINVRGIQIDTEAVKVFRDAYDLAVEEANNAVWQITGGEVEKASEVQKMLQYLHRCNLVLPNLDKETVEAALERPEIQGPIRDLLEIRQAMASAGAKKLQALTFRTCHDGRMRDAFNYHRAHTGRFSSEGIQLQNMVAGGPECILTPCCGVWLPKGLYPFCPCCAVSDPLEGPGLQASEWGVEPMTSFIDECKRIKDPKAITDVYGSKLAGLIASSIRGLITAAPGKELICSDYTAIEAVVLAVLSGCQWRIDLFATHGKIYEKTASDITGISFEDLLRYKEETGSHHPHRKPFGKVPELASGYQGWIGAWKAFGADQFMDDDTIKKSILAWRAASPEIVELWGGQWREVDRYKFEHEYYGLEGTAIKAVLEPGQWHTYRWLRYGVFGDVLYCLLPSGRAIAYHKPRLERGIDRYSKKEIYSLSHMFNNTNPKKGAVGWIRVQTYGGMLTENATQGVARDLLVNGMKNVEPAGYPVVGHVHDELISEVDLGFGSIEEYEHLMTKLPAWAEGWPIKADGGWRGQRYRKD